MQGFSVTVQEQGLKGLVRGWFPTLVGYSVQGAGKFGERPLPAAAVHLPPHLRRLCCALAACGAVASSVCQHVRLLCAGLYEYFKQ
jgi:hypothetical protein